MLVGGPEPTDSGENSRGVLVAWRLATGKLELLSGVEASNAYVPPCRMPVVEGVSCHLPGYQTSDKPRNSQVKCKTGRVLPRLPQTH